jgi:hypothetical protein
VLAACRTGLGCVFARLRAAPPATAAGSGAVRATRRGWIGGCHRRVPGRGRRSAPARALLILPRVADRRCSGRAWWRQAAQAWRISCATCSSAGTPWHHLIARLRLSRSRPAARRRDVLAWACGEARSQATDGADGRRHGPRGHDCGSSSAALHVGGTAGGSGGGSCSSGDGRIRYAGDGARLAVAACCASAEFHDRAAGCATSPILRGWP